MSSADFPGSSWQDRPGSPDGPDRRYRGRREAGNGAAEQSRATARQPRRQSGQRPRDYWQDTNGGGNGWRLAASRTSDGYRGGYGNGENAGRGAGSPGSGRAGGQALKSMPPRGRGTGGNGGSGNGYYRPVRGRPPQRPSHWPWRASWWRHWSIKKVALLIGGAVAAAVFAAVGAFFVEYTQVQVPAAVLDASLPQSSVVYYAGGHKVVGTFASYNRTLLSETDVAKCTTLTAAVIAAEDRHFETEGGISITGTVRAALVDVSGSGFQGASTITEQLVKNYFDRGGGNLTYKEKLKEIIVAIKLAKIRSKPWILTNYLNTIYFGSGAWGAQAAARTYFGKNAEQLNVPQAAMIAAMINQPGFFDPHPGQPGYPELVARWQYVLQNMVRDGVLSRQQAQSYGAYATVAVAERNFPVVQKASSANGWKGWNGYVMSAVRQELESRYGITASQLYDGGYRIVTTVSLAKMRALYNAVADEKKLMAQDGSPFPWYAHIGAVLEQPGTGAILAWYGGPNFEAKPKYCTLISCQYDEALVSRHQVGSSFKPYVLATAVQQGMDVQNSILFGSSPACIPPESEPTAPSIPGGNGLTCLPAHPLYQPVSYDPVVEGPTTVAKATALSSNAAFEDLQHKVTTSATIRLAQQLGVDISCAYSEKHTNCNGSGLSGDVGEVGIALGIAPLTVEEQASTFATLANTAQPGWYVQPHVIASISQNGQQSPIRVIRRAVFTPAQVADIDWALSFDTVYGTGVPNAMLYPSRPTIAKTGTTEFGQSAFFIGATPGQYSFAVGMFTDVQNDKQGAQSLHALNPVGGIQGEYGGAWPAKLWQMYMGQLLAAKPVAQLQPLDLSGFVPWTQQKALPHKHKHKQCRIIFGGCPGGQPSPGGTPSPGAPTTPAGQQPADVPGLPAHGHR